MQTATHRTLPESVVEAYANMASGISRKQIGELKWRLDDAARGRPVKPLGPYPEVAEACIAAGAAPANVLAPLAVMKAHILRRFRGKLPDAMKEALTYAAKERAEAECPEVCLTLSANCPEHSVLAAFVKEKREELIAEEHVVELAEERLAALGAL